ncbi:Crp/Fnr family transcriptional regulator [Paenibacillus whitsoniae]|uniref:Crp/Fnr family transcriptional regulator n=1 Tax=Paenibacillus whitsoniae TaxID=2496558 RepID=A0A3S0C9X6_9BACL|nr:Crp/Fnr family transcriptional regulator [Paenibacillus whitsoniae]RTE08173.1 Crp/Fnr family transcriptional regulator [Paenibacillus whitsoniae]
MKKLPVSRDRAILQPLQDMTSITSLFPCFGELSEQDWLLAQKVRVSPSTPHEIAEGHRLSHALFVVSGSVRIYKISPGGREVTLYRVGPGECCVLMIASILGETEYEASVQIETETEVLLFPVTAFRKWMHAYPSLRRSIYRQFTERFIRVTSLLEQIAFGSLPERVASYLLQRLPKSEGATEIRVTHEQLAVELGTAREVVSRILKEMAVTGAISLQRGKINVLDQAQLHRYCSPL